MAAVVVTAAYGLFSLLGGVIGFVKARSKASLIAGAASGVLLLGCAHAMHRHGSLPAALGALAVAGLLGARFTATWLRTRRLMPDLLMVLFSLATVLSVGVRLLAR